MGLIELSFWGVIGLLLTISLLVAVHEYGHYIVARMCGIKVLRFSIGFGKPIWSKRAGKDNTEYCISSLPLGGYVKMLDEREGEVDPADRDRTFNAQPVWQRIAVLLAGPAFNFIFAVAAYWVLFVHGTYVTRPVVGSVVPESPAAVAGLQYGDIVAAVGDRQIESWQGAGVLAIVNEIVDDGELPLVIERADGTRESLILRVDESTARLAKPGKLWEGLGFQPWAARAIVGGFADESPAREAGLQISDQVLAVNEVAVATFEDMAREIWKYPNESVSLSVMRGDQPLWIDVTAGVVIDDEGASFGRIGVSPADQRPDNLWVFKQLGVGDAVPAAWQRTKDYIGTTFSVFGRMITGSVSVKNISGPISIGSYASQALRGGFDRFIDLLAMVSISLGVLNLLPVPMLDGGQIVYQSIEGVTGKPLSEKWQMIGQQFGVAVLLCVMSLAFYNDIARLVGDLLT